MFGNFTGQTLVDSDGFAPPTFGGALAVRFNTVAFTDTTPKTLFTLPQGAVIVAFIVNVSTAFNSSGDDFLDIGDDVTGNRFADNLNVDTVGQIVSGFDDDELFSALAAETTVTATYAPGVADQNAGAATVAAIYMVR